MTLFLLGGCQTVGEGGGELVSSTGSLPGADPVAESASTGFSSLAPGQRPPISSDEAGWWMVMDNVENKARTAGNRVRDPELNAYINRIVCRVAGQFCKDIRVYLIRVPHFNATMAPNGMMQIWTGLILRARNEAQLAAVIGHEIGHYLRRHTLQRMRSVSSTADFMIFFQIGLAAVGIPLVGDIAQLAALGMLQAHSRDHEREADMIGLELMYKAGYDPREASKVWAQIIEERDAERVVKKVSENSEEEGDETQDSSPPVFLASHPPSEERRKTLAVLAQRRIADGSTGETGRDRFLLETRKFRSRLLRDELHVRNFKRALFLAESLIEDGSALGELYYFKGEIYRLRNDSKKKDLESAVAAYEKASEFDNAPPALYRSLGLAYKKLDKPDLSRKAYRKYLELDPGASDAEFIRQMISTIETQSRNGST